MCEASDVPMTVGKQMMTEWHTVARQQNNLTFLPVCHDGYVVHKRPGRNYSLCTVTAKQTYPTKPTHAIAQSLSRDLLCKLSTFREAPSRNTVIIGPIPEIVVQPHEWCIQLTCLVLIEHT